MKLASQGLVGVLSVLSTPFEPSGEIDLVSLRRLVDYQIAWGADGIVVFGLAGELYKLTDDERREILDVVVEQVGSRALVIVGTEHTGTEGAIKRSREAEAAGASALMVYPPTFVRPDTYGVIDYYKSVGSNVGIPVIVQDAPAWTGITLSVEVLVKIFNACENVCLVKVESPPATSKIRELRKCGLGVIGGYGVLHLLDDLRAGVQAIMPGCAMPGLYKRLWSLHESGQNDRLRSEFNLILPLLSYQMSHLDVFVAVQKFLLSGIGVLDSATMRRPSIGLETDFESVVNELVEHTGAKAYVSWPEKSD